ncbi:MAG: hypothetical protein WDO15_07605 [Bacteroidota bacterium]
MKYFIKALLISTISLNASAQVGIFQSSTDIGNPKNAGSSAYDAKTQEYSIKGGGSNIWFNHDEFHFAYNKIKGDFILTANFEFTGAGTNGHRKIGWMIRSSADADASHASAVIHGDGLITLQCVSFAAHSCAILKTRSSSRKRKHR